MPNKSSDSAILVFLKAPIAGKVKTRLAADIGDKNAVAVYKALLKHTVQLVESYPADAIGFHENFPQPKDSFLHSFMDWREQDGKDLGERMQKAIQWSFENGYKKVVLIGTDCPELGKSNLDAAFNSLDTNPVCFGPAKDGGYYLVGMSKFSPEIFADITWSTETVLEESLKRLKKVGKSFALIDELTDIDHLSDLRQFPTYARIAGL